MEALLAFYLVGVEVLSLGVEQLRHEVDCATVSSAEGKNDWNCTSSLHVCFCALHRDCTFPFDMLIMWISEIGYSS